MGYDELLDRCVVQGLEIESEHVERSYGEVSFSSEVLEGYATMLNAFLACLIP